MTVSPSVFKKGMSIHSDSVLADLMSRLRPPARPCYDETRDDDSIAGVIRTRRRCHCIVFRAHPGVAGPGCRATLGDITRRDALDAAEPRSTARARHRVWRGSALGLLPRQSTRCAP